MMPEPATPKFLRLTLRSDTTFGRGDGVAGLVDQEIEHDFRTGLPFVRGRTLKGLLVEECAEVLFSLRKAESPAIGAFEKAAQFLFGAPGSGLGGQACLEIGRGHLPKPFREAVAATVERGTLHPDEVLDAFTTLRRQTATDDATGAPLEHTLRASRVLRPGLSLYAPLHFLSDPTPAALALLAACACALHRGGTSRTRGRGRLRAQLVETLDPDEATQTLTSAHFTRFGELLKNPPPDTPVVHDESKPKAKSQSNAGTNEDNATKQTTPATLHFDLRLEQPLLATTVNGEPNSAVSADHIPGALLRGALAGRFIAQRRLSADHAATDAAFRRLFLDGTTRFLNGYPLVQQNYEKQLALPTPASYFHDKGSEHELQDFALEEPPADPTGTKQWKRVGTPFLTLPSNSDTLFRLDVERHVTIHTLRDRHAGRATRASGEIFRYDALTPALRFRAAIRCSSAEDAKAIKKLFPEDGILQLGGSRSVDYGRVSIVPDSIAVEEQQTWHEAGSGTPEASEDGWIVLTLTSDAILRDPATGQHAATAEAFAHAVAQRLKGDDKEPPVLSFQDKQGHPRVFLNTDIVGGFNRKWNLPLPQTLALRRGSVFTFHFPGGAPDKLKERLARLEEEGLGERRAEGFGRVTVGCLAGRAISYYAQSPDPEAPPFTDSDLTAGTEAYRLAGEVAENILRRRLDLLLTKKASIIAQEIKSPTASQLQRLRLAFRNALRKEAGAGRGYLNGFLRGLPATARGQLEKDRLSLTLERGKGAFLKWLHERHQDTGEGRGGAQIWSILEVNEKDIPKVGDVEAELTDALAFEYNVRLALAVLIRAAQNKRRDNAG